MEKMDIRIEITDTETGAIRVNGWQKGKPTNPIACIAYLDLARNIVNNHVVEESTKLIKAAPGPLPPFPGGKGRA